MTLFNLSLTRELNQQMAEKDQQMNEKDQQLAEKDKQMAEKDKQMAEKDKQMAEKDQQLANLMEQNRKLQEQLQQLGIQTGKQLQELDQLQFHQHLVITDYSAKKRRPNNTPQGMTHYYECISDPFYCQAYRFEFSIDILQNGDIRAYFRLLAGRNDHSLPWPIKCTIHLVLLNQLGDYGHHLAVVTKQLGKTDIDEWIVIKDAFAVSAELQFNALRRTLYLQDDSLHSRLYLNVCRRF